MCTHVNLRDLIPGPESNRSYNSIKHNDNKVGNGYTRTKPSFPMRCICSIPSIPCTKPKLQIHIIDILCIETTRYTQIKLILHNGYLLFAKKRLLQVTLDNGVKAFLIATTVPFGCGRGVCKSVCCRVTRS